MNTKRKMPPNIDCLIHECIDEITNREIHSLFVLRRRFILPTPTSWGNYFYSTDDKLKKELEVYMTSKDFLRGGYSEAASEPILDNLPAGSQSRCVEKIINVLKTKEPENLVFYLRHEQEIVSARIFIPIPDFYGGLTDEEAIKKYGEETFRKMTKHLKGITISKSCDGKTRIPYGDLNYAHKKAVGLKTSPEEWD